MGTGYTRNDTANNIADGNVINASDLDGEFDAVQAAFNGTTGHSHDGTTGEGPQIATSGLADNAVTTAKITDANVTTAKIADSNVTTAKIADANVTTAKIANDAVTLGTKTSGNYVAAGATSGTGISGSVSSEGGTFTVTSNATNANTAGTIVARDGSGNFSAGTITASLTGTASNANQLDSLDSTQFLRSDASDTKTSGDLSFSDGVQANFGASNDLQIYHDGLNSYIDDTGTGNLRIRGTHLQLQDRDGNDFILCTDTGTGGTVEIRHNTVTKLNTTATGVSVTGNVAVTGTVDGRDVASDGSKLDGIESGATADQSASEILTLIKTVDGAGSGLDADTLDGVSSGSFLRSDAADTKTSGTLNFSDNVSCSFGASNDLILYHDAANSYIDSIGTGALYIRQRTNDQDIVIQSDDAGGQEATYILCDGSTGAVTINYYGSTKLSTKTDGVLITGELEATTLDINGAANISSTLTMGSHIFLQDNDYLQLGSSQDLLIYHDGSNSHIVDQGTGNLNISADNFNVYNAAGTELKINATTNGAVNLYYDNVLRLATTSTGIGVTGSGTNSNIAVSVNDDGSANAPDIFLYRNSASPAANDGIGNLTFRGNDSAANDTTYASIEGYIASATNGSEQGRISFFLNHNNSINEEFRMESDGDFHADANVIAHSTTVSDERLKENIKKIENATDKVNQLNGYTFNYKKDGRKGAGVIAQEVEKVLPSAVMEKQLPLKNDDGVAYKIVEYDQIIGLLIESIKELKQEINTLKGE